MTSVSPFWLWALTHTSWAPLTPHCVRSLPATEPTSSSPSARVTRRFNALLSLPALKIVVRCRSDCVLRCCAPDQGPCSPERRCRHCSGGGLPHRCVLSEHREQTDRLALLEHTRLRSTLRCVQASSTRCSLPSRTRRSHTESLSELSSRHALPLASCLLPLASCLLPAALVVRT